MFGNVNSITILLLSSVAVKKTPYAIDNSVRLYLTPYLSVSHTRALCQNDF